ncbi:NigD1/NigD2 family lipoprotein [Coprobacter sp.]
MKHLFQLILLCTITTFISCNDDDIKFNYGNFRMDFVTVLSSETGIKFLRDDGMTLFSATNSANSEYLNPGNRIILRYIPGEKISPTEQSADIQSISVVPQGDIRLSMKEQAESFGNDPLYIISLWPGGGYLNLRYKIELNNAHHQLVMFYIPENQISQDTLYLELRHKANSNNPGYLSKGYASFALEKIHNSIQKVKAIKVNTNIYNLKQQYFIFNTETL